MKISELMEKLGELQGEHGDVDVVYMAEVDVIPYDFEIEPEPSFHEGKVIL